MIDFGGFFELIIPFNQVGVPLIQPGEKSDILRSHFGGDDFSSPVEESDASPAILGEDHIAFYEWDGDHIVA